MFGPVSHCYPKRFNPCASSLVMAVLLTRFRKQIRQEVQVQVVETPAEEQIGKVEGVQ